MKIFFARERALCGFDQLTSALHHSHEILRESHHSLSVFSFTVPGHVMLTLEGFIEGIVEVIELCDKDDHSFFVPFFQYSTIISHFSDVITDILVLIIYFNHGHTVLFWVSISIFIVTQVFVYCTPSTHTRVDRTHGCTVHSHRTQTKQIWNGILSSGAFAPPTRNYFRRPRKCLRTPSKYQFMFFVLGCFLGPFIPFVLWLGQFSNQSSPIFAFNLLDASQKN